MSDITINPSCLSGSIEIPPSKSICHRAIICAGLSAGTSHIENVQFSEDILATIRAMKALGVYIEKGHADLQIQGFDTIFPVNPLINCSESGSTLRFLIPLALIGQKMIFTGKGKLVERPLDAYFQILNQQQIPYQTENGHLPLSVSGILKPGQFHLPGNVSSQFISGLLFALPKLPGDSSIVITNNLESRGYIDLTLSILARFGISVKNNDYQELIIPGNQQYHPTDYRVESDYSQAAFWLVAGTIGSSVQCSGLNPISLQGDRVILNIIRNMGGNVEDSNMIIAHPAQTFGTTIDASQCPDLVPIIAVLAAVSEGTTHIVKAGRLRIKESDRLHAITKELTTLGANIQESSDSLTIHGRPHLTGGANVDSWNDHRIAMALAIASIKCQNPITIKNSDCVKKSYPDFWQDFVKLGGKFK